ncbi:MAG: DUF3489 domain-containing protein [Reyranellaceae bacterium]
MTKLSDSQLVILSAACQRADRLALPLPDRLKGGAAQKVVASLMAKKLIEEVDAKRGEPVWRETGDGHGVTLVATDAAFAAIGIDPDEAPKTSRAAQPRRAPAAPRTRADTKQAHLIAMLQRPEGATVAEIADALGWQHHTVRGAIAGALKKKLGLEVESEKIDERGRVYRIGV